MHALPSAPAAAARAVRGPAGRRSAQRRRSRSRWSLFAVVFALRMARPEPGERRGGAVRRSRSACSRCGSGCAAALGGRAARARCWSLLWSSVDRRRARSTTIGYVERALTIVVAGDACWAPSSTIGAARRRRSFATTTPRSDLLATADIERLLHAREPGVGADARALGRDALLAGRSSTSCIPTTARRRSRETRRPRRAAHETVGFRNRYRAADGELPLAGMERLGARRRRRDPRGRARRHRPARSRGSAGRQREVARKARSPSARASSTTRAPRRCASWRSPPSIATTTPASTPSASAHVAARLALGLGLPAGQVDAAAPGRAAARRRQAGDPGPHPAQAGQADARRSST